MKYGAHIFLWTERWSNNEISLIGRAKSLGLDCLEIAVGDDVEFDSQFIKKEFQKQSVDIFISPGGTWPMEADISLADKNMARGGVEWHKRWMEKGAEAGALAYTGAIYGHPGNVVKSAPDPDEYKRICEHLHALAEFGRQHGIKLVLEPMSHFRTHLANTGKQLISLIEGADHGNLYCLLDTYHMVTEVRDFGREILLMKDKLYSVHACENDRGVPGGGIIPWDEIGNALSSSGFDKFIILESYNSSVREGNFAFERGMFHNVCPDGDDFVRKGIHFLKSKLMMRHL